MVNLSDCQKFTFVQKDEHLIVNWSSIPTNILIVHKFCDESVLEDLKQISVFILKNWDVVVFLEGDTLSVLQKDSVFALILDKYMARGTTQSEVVNPVCAAVDHRDYNPKSTVKLFEKCSAHLIDMVICLGGDGTLLKISSIFQGIVPPVLAFRLGTLGFLTPLPFKSYPTSLRCAIEGSPRCLMRSRLRCLVVRGISKSNSADTGTQSDSSRSTSPDTEYHFLNELVVDRGLSACSCDLLIKVNGRVVTHCEGDGLIVSTPTGSTAYSMAAGASMVHPAVPAFVLTPINSLTLSSRAIVLPISLRLEISINPVARCKAVHFSFDGRSRASNLLRDGDSIIVTGSPHPVPCLSCDDQGIDWFCGLHNLLNWNTRSRIRGLSGCPDPENDNPSS